MKWFKKHCRVLRELRQRCKVCGCADGYDFHVSDEVWESIVPKKYQTKVVCLSCFDDFAKEIEADYSTSIKTLYFAGNNHGFKFERVLMD
jgi:hypothetical protein